MLTPRYTRTHRYLKITILCTSTCVYTHRYKNYTIYLHICRHILTYGRAGTVAGIPPITTSAGARTLAPLSRSPPGCRCILPKGFIKTQRTETGTHGVRRERGGVAYSCRQPPARGHHRGTVGVTALAGVPVPAPAIPSLHPCAPSPAHARTPQTLPQPRCWDSTGLPAAALAHTDGLAGAGGRHARVQTPRGRRNGPYREAQEPTRPRTGAPAQPAGKQGAHRPPLTPHRQQ